MSPFTGKRGVGGTLAKIQILRRFKLRRFDQNQGNHPFGIVQNNRDANLNFLAGFHEKVPTHIDETYAITIFEQIF